MEAVDATERLRVERDIRKSCELSDACRTVLAIYKGLRCLAPVWRRLPEKAVVHHLTRRANPLPASTVRAAVRRLADRRALALQGRTSDGSPIYSYREER